MCYQGRIEPPKAARGHATSYSVHRDGIVLSATKNNVPVKHKNLCVRYSYGHSTELFPGQGR